MFALALLPFAGHADQLALLPRADVEKVVKSIQHDIWQRHGEPYYMVSYCSRCDRDYIEVWEVKKVVTVAVTEAIPESDYFQMHVFGRRILRSSEAIREGKYQEPIQYEPIPENDPKWFFQGVDLAYVYAPSSDDSFLCIGKNKVYQLKCDVHVERINIPEDAFKKVEKTNGNKAIDGE